MLTLDQTPGIPSENHSAVRAFKAQRLAQLKNSLQVYFGFTSGADVAGALALRSVTGEVNANLPVGTATANERAPVLVEQSRRNIEEVGIRANPAIAAVFEDLIDSGEGARKALDSDGSEASIKKRLEARLLGLNGDALATAKHNVARCAKIHYCNNVVPNPATASAPGERDRVFFNDLDGALPFEGSAAAVEDKKKRVAAIRMEHPLLMPGEKNSELLTVFFNAMPTLELARATPVLNITVYSSRPVLEGGKLAAISLQKFLEGSRTIGDQDISQRAIALANQVTASLFGQRDQGFENYSTVGMELFRSPQTLVNLDAVKETDNYLAPVIDPMRPLASIKSFGIDVKSAYGIQGTRTATLEMVLHDRSRLGEFADFVKPDRYGTSFIEVEYGWLHPDPLTANNPFADLLNLTRVKEHFNVVRSNFNFDDVGQVNITLNCMGRGASEMSELSIVGPGAAGRAQTQIRHLEELSRTINELASRAFPQPTETPSSARQGTQGAQRREIRGQQALSAAGDATNNLVLSRELLREMRTLQQTLQTRSSGSSARGIDPSIRQAASALDARIRELVGNFRSGGSARAPREGSELNNIQRTINGEIRGILNRINPTPNATRENAYGDAFLSTIPAEVWSTLIDSRNGESIDSEHADAIRSDSEVNGQLATTGRTTGNNAAGALNRSVQEWTGKKVVSLGTLLMAFVAKPLAELPNTASTDPNSPKFEEVQVYFYNFNNKASLMSRCNISQFPVNVKYFIREYSRLRLENANRTVNLSVNEFLNFVATKIVDDVMNPAYKISNLYRRNRDQLTPVRPQTHDQQMLTKMRQFNISRHNDFVMPQVSFDIEAVPAVIGNGPGDRVGSTEQGRGKTILKIHVYDRACSPNSSFRELLSLPTNNLMSSLSTFPGGTEQRAANEAEARRLGEDVSVLRENWRELQEKVVRESVARGLIVEIPPRPGSSADSTTQYRFVGGPRKLKEYVMKNVPNITYGCMGSTIKSAQLSSMSDPALNAINMQRSLSATPILPNGEQPGGVPLSIYPVELTMTSLGCPFLRYGQELFVDYGTNTSADNIYYVTGLQHKIEAGTFDTVIKLTANDAFGQYRNLIGQLNAGEQTLGALPGR